MAQAVTQQSPRKSVYGAYSRVVLVAIDPSEYSRIAFQWYLVNVWRSEDLIVLCYCPEPPNLSTFSFKTGITLPTTDWTKMIETQNEKARKLHEDFEQECIGKKLKYKMRVEAFERAGEGLCKIADEEKADFIIIGARGISNMKRALMGSVSAYVMNNSTRPCFVVRPKQLANVPIKQ